MQNPCKSIWKNCTQRLIKLSSGADGLFYGNPKLFGVQAYGAFATIIYSMIVTFIILKAIDAIVGLRVDADAEVRGLDLAEHSEAGYTI